MEREEAAWGFPPERVGQVIRDGFISSIRRAEWESLSFRQQYDAETLN